MGEHTPVLQDSETVEVNLDFTRRAQRQLQSMQEPARELAQAALFALAARLGNYFSEEIDGISYIGRTREQVFTIVFEVFGPYKATIHDIVMGWAPIDESTGSFRISRNGQVTIVPAPSNDSTHSRIVQIINDSEILVEFGHSYTEYSVDDLNLIKYRDNYLVSIGFSINSDHFQNGTFTIVEFSDFLTEHLASSFAAFTADVGCPVDLSYLASRDIRRFMSGDSAAMLLRVQMSRQCIDVAAAVRWTD